MPVIPVGNIGPSLKTLQHLFIIRELGEIIRGTAECRPDYLEQYKRVTYLNLLTSGELNKHLYEVEQTALTRLELLTKQLSAEQGVTEELKEKAPMQWVGLMNSIRSQAEEVILSELIYA